MAATAHVPLSRPYLDSDPLDHWPPTRAECEETPPDWEPAPPLLPQFVPRPRETHSGQQARLGGYGDTGPQPRFVPRLEPAPPPPPALEAPRPARAVPDTRALIGDEIRIPILWCEFGQCIHSYTHPDALGERDLRDLAYADGWRYDALARLACPSCVQCDSSFWATRTPALLRRD